MRDSVGATWVFSICLAFIILFTCYLAITINYAKAFRIKSHIVTLVEEYEGYPESGVNHEKLVGDIDNYLYSQGYDATGTCEPYIAIAEKENEQWDLLDEEGLLDGLSNRHRYCIYKRVSRNTEKICDEKYYKVIVFFKFDLPLIGYLTSFRASGETRLLYDFANGGCVVPNPNLDVSET